MLGLWLLQGLRGLRLEGVRDVLRWDGRRTDYADGFGLRDHCGEESPGGSPCEQEEVCQTGYSDTERKGNMTSNALIEKFPDVT